MNRLACLFWLEFRRTTWVFYGAALGLALYTLVLLSLPGVVTGLDVFAVPTAGEDENAAGESIFEMNRETDEGSETRSFRFSRSWGWGDDADETATAPSTPGAAEAENDNSIVDLELPEELQVAFRPRQAASVMASLALPALLLLGFWISHLREAESGEMVILYQSPISGDTQLAVRFVFMGGCAFGTALAAVGIYHAVQAAQSLSASAPVAEGFGAYATIDWSNLLLVSGATQILPVAAFVLLFVQMQNAYDLLGGKRIVGMVMLLAGLFASVGAYFTWVANAQAPAALLAILRVQNSPVLDAVPGDFDPSRYRYDVPIEFVVAALVMTTLMMILAGRVWREVEWS